MSICSEDMKFSFFKNADVNTDVYFNVIKDASGKSSIPVTGGIYSHNGTHIMAIQVEQGKLPMLMEYVGREMNQLMNDKVLVGSPIQWHDKNWPESSLSNVAAPGCYIDSYAQFNQMYKTWKSGKLKLVKKF